MLYLNPAWGYQTSIYEQPFFLEPLNFCEYEFLSGEKLVKHYCKQNKMFLKHLKITFLSVFLNFLNLTFLMVQRII